MDVPAARRPRSGRRCARPGRAWRTPRPSGWATRSSARSTAKSRSSARSKRSAHDARVHGHGRGRDHEAERARLRAPQAPRGRVRSIVEPPRRLEHALPRGRPHGEIGASFRMRDAVDLETPGRHGHVEQPRPRRLQTVRHCRSSGRLAPAPARAGTGSNARSRRRPRPAGAGHERGVGAEQERDHGRDLCRRARRPRG